MLGRIDLVKEPVTDKSMGYERMYKALVHSRFGVKDVGRYVP